MNELYQVSNYVIEKFKTNPIVNTISYEKTREIDYNKENIYPLVNVDLTDSNHLDSLLQFNFTITILQQRDIDNELNNDKLLNKDNLIDNLNETYSISNKFINAIKNNYNDLDIEIDTVSNIRMVKLSETNLLDGVQFTLLLSIPNTTGC